MKKFIAFGVALAVLLFSFVPAMGNADVKEEIKVCSDLDPDPNMYDQCSSC